MYLVNNNEYYKKNKKNGIKKGGCQCYFKYIEQNCYLFSPHPMDQQVSPSYYNLVIFCQRKVTPIGSLHAEKKC